MSTDFRKILTGTDFDTLEDAIAADLVSAIPVVGTVSDFLRLLESESKPQKALQALDMITSPLPFADIFTPTNTLLYLDKKGQLPVPIDEVTKFFEQLPGLKGINNIQLIKKK